MVDLADVLFLRRVVVADIQHQRLEQIEFRVVPKVVALLTAGILYNHITKQLGHQFLTLNLRQAVPGIRGGGRYQIEYADGIALVTQVLTGFFVQFRFRIRNDHAVAPCSTLQNHIDTEGSGLFRSGGPIYGDIPIESGILWDTHHLAVQFPQNRPVVLANVGNQVKDAFHLLFGHETGRSVGALVGVNEIAIPVIFSCLAVAHTHDHENQNTDDRDADPHTIQAVRESESRQNTGQETGAWELR